MLKRMAHKVKTLLCGKRGARAERGESLVEVLTAIVIGGLALLVLGMAISTASNMALDSRKTMDDYYQANTAIASGEATVLGAGSVALASEDGSAVALIESGESLQVRYCQSDGLGSTTVVLYETGSGAQTGGGA